MKKLIFIPVIVLLSILLVLITDNMGELKIEVKGGAIFGTLLEPSKNPGSSLVIITAGSGPTDRNGNTPLLEGRSDALKALAYSLKDNSIASFRYDQRPSGKSIKTMKDRTTDINMLVDDLVKCIRYIKQNKNYERIYLIGHSQGAIVSVLAAQKEDVAGVILVTGPGRPIDEIMVEQYANIRPDIVNQVKEEMKSIREGRDSVVQDEEMKRVFNEENRSFLRSWMAYDPPKEVRKLKSPICVIYGTSDSQVTPVEIQFYGDIINDRNSKIVNNMNHVLKVSPKDAKENQKRYTDPSYPIHPELVSTIMEFIKQP